MAEVPEGMTILEVLPHNYDKIIELSKTTQNPYTVEDLDQMRARARARNSVVSVMFMSPDFWTKGKE